MWVSQMTHANCRKRMITDLCHNGKTEFHFLKQIRRPIGTTFELLVPLAFVCVLLVPK